MPQSGIVKYHVKLSYEVDPLIRNQLMGHSSISASSNDGLGMTGVYTHTRPTTMKQQLHGALHARPAIEFARSWLKNQRRGGNGTGRS